MPTRGQPPRPARLIGLGVLAPAIALLGGCQGYVGAGPGAPGTGAGAPTGTGGAGNIVGGGGNGPVTGTGGTGMTTAGPCSGDPVLARKRLVRLTFNQVVGSIRSLLDATLADRLAADFQIVDAAHRTFPPLNNPREGAVVIADVWSTSDRIAEQAAKYVLDNFARVTACATATDTCARTFTRAFTAKAFRRPPTADETADIEKVYTDVKGFGGTVQEATQFAVYATLSSPAFLYRSELGTGGDQAGPLTPHELASALSYFLTDGPPDAVLTDAAANGQLATDAQVRAQVDRILATPATKTNLQGAMLGYFKVSDIDNIVIDTGKFPAFNEGVRNSMYREAELFLEGVLWGGRLVDLVTARRSPINATLAPLYGVAAPAGADSSTFVPVDLPASRAGILTMPGFLLARARPQAGSVIGRGLLVNETFLCAQNPAFPESLAPQIEAVSAQLADATEKEKAAFRADPSTACAGCHLGFDSYGLALESFDTIGKHRTVDERGRPIDTQVLLPPAAGGETVPDAAAMGAALAKTVAFPACVAKNMMTFALGESAVGVSAGSCAVRQAVERFQAGDGSFTSLVREIALSRTVSVRLPGGGAP